MVPLLEGRTRQPHPQLTWYWSGNRAIRQGDWKLVWDKIPKRWELFDLSKDRCETNNLATAHPQRVKKMTADWTTWSKKVALNPPKPN